MFRPAGADQPLLDRVQRRLRNEDRIRYWYETPAPPRFHACRSTSSYGDYHVCACGSESRSRMPFSWHNRNVRRNGGRLALTAEGCRRVGVEPLPLPGYVPRTEHFAALVGEHQ
jgi:hypothetical protein